MVRPPSSPIPPTLRSAARAAAARAAAAAAAATHRPPLSSAPSRSIGDGEGYGHVGDTYGYQSQTTFFPEHGFVLTVATNVETTSQAQPADATCVGYHAVLAAMQGTPPPTCTFNVPHHFIGTCNCTSASA